MDNAKKARNPKKRKFHQYSEEDLQKAVEAIRQGVKIREASRHYNVPRATIQDRIKGRVGDKPRRMGPDPFLSRENENKIVQWIINIAKCGFPIKKSELINTVQKIVVEEKIKTPFKDSKPGQKWYASFLKRHPEISARTAESVDKSRGKLTKEYIQSWFRELEIHLESLDATDLLEDPSRIFNADESGFSLCPKTGKVLAPKGYKNLYEVKKGSEKDNVTVLVTFSADGKLCPPCVVYPYIKPPRAIAEKMPEDWILGKSDSGWMKSDVFFEYVANGLHQWILEHNIKKPVLFFVDGHRSHMSVELSQFCDKNGIILYALPPNSTHMMQPADVAVFKPLKEYWRHAVRSWQSENEEKTLTKVYFASVFKRALDNTKMSEHIKNGFRRCGLYPYDMEAVDYSKCIQNTLENMNNDENIDDDGNVLRNVQEAALTPTDFKSAHKVLISLKSNLNHRAEDVDKILSELEKFEESLRHSSQPSACDEFQETLVEDGNCVLKEYEVNNDGFLSLLLTNEPNILQVDVLHEGREGTTSNEDFVSAGENAESTFIPTNEPNVLQVDILHEGREETTSNEEAFVSAAKNAESTFIPTNEPKIKTLEVDILPKERKGIMKNEKFVAAAENVESTFIPTNEPNISQVDILPKENKGTIRANKEFVAAAENAESTLIPTNEPKIKILQVDTLRKGTTANEEFVDAAKNPELNPTNNTISAFDKHLTYPKPLLKSKRSKSGPTTSAISAKAWRTYYIEKEKKKEEQEKIKERKRELAKRKKSEIIMGGKKKRKPKQQDKLFEEAKAASVTPIKQKCGSCQDELESDAEEEGEKNIGCDTCTRWFHLKCTELAGQTYEDVMHLDFYCNLCT